MSKDDNENSGMYWSVVVPGMTEDQADWMLARAGGEPYGLAGSTVDPSHLLSLHIDRHSVETLKVSLLMLKSSDANVELRGIGRGLLEALDDWLAADGKYLDD
jgi:hypothetical protein